MNGINFLEPNYTKQQITSDLSFLRYILKKRCKKQFNDKDGIGRLEKLCEQYVASANTADENVRACSVLNILTDSLKTLWFNDVDFCLPLGSMNTGGITYGDKSVGNNFKDFEYELFIAAGLAKEGIAIEMPCESNNSDVIIGNVEIECKQPGSIDQVATHLNNFHKRVCERSVLNRDLYGIFALAVEDLFDFADRLQFDSQDEQAEYVDSKLKVVESTLRPRIESALSDKTRILGAIITSTVTFKLNGAGITTYRKSNSVFCFRPDRAEIKDTHYRDVYNLLRPFNNSPSWISF